MSLLGRFGDLLIFNEQNQWTGFYMISASVMKGLTELCHQQNYGSFNDLWSLIKVKVIHVYKENY